MSETFLNIKLFFNHLIQRAKSVVIMFSPLGMIIIMMKWTGRAEREKKIKEYSSSPDNPLTRKN